MFKFTIFAKESWCDVKGGGRHQCLSKDVFACYNSDYVGGEGRWKLIGTIENVISVLKNDVTPYSEEELKRVINQLSDILMNDLSEYFNMAKNNGYSSITVCVIPRAKREDSYGDNQKLFRKTVQDVVNKLKNSVTGLNIVDGTHYIIRNKDTATTHLSRHGGLINGDLPYCGITKETCLIENVDGQDVLLIDDLYTKTVCIDEDAIQALYDNGARNVFFYSIGRTIKK